MLDALQVSQPALQCIVRICLHSVQNIKVRCSRTYGDNLHDAFAVRVAEIIYSDQCVLRFDAAGRSSILHATAEALELHPVKTMLPVCCTTTACFGDNQLVALGHIVVIAAVWHSVVLLYKDDVIFAERIVQLTILGIQVYLATLRVVVINLHHACEDAVVVLAQELGDYHFVNSERSSHNDVIELSCPLILLHPCSIGNRLVVDAPSLSSEESRYKLLTEEVAVKGRISFNVQLLHGGESPCQQLIYAESVFPCLCILDCNRKTFLLTFVEVRRRKLVGCYAICFYAAGDDIAGSIEAIYLSNLQTFQEVDETCSLIIIHLREVLTIGLLQQFLDDCLHFIRGEMKQREKSIAYAVSRIGCQATLISDTLELGL